MRQLFIVLLALVGTGCGQSVILSGSAKLGSGSVTMGIVCGPPTYNCTRTDLNIVKLPPVVPSVGGLTGAGTIVSDDMGNSNKVLRITDSAFDPSRANVEYVVAGSGSGDMNLFSRPFGGHTLLAIQESGNLAYVVDINNSTLAVTRPYVSSYSSTGGWVSPYDVTSSWGHTNNLMYQVNHQFLASFDWTDWMTGPKTTPPAAVNQFDFTELTPGLPNYSAGNCLPSGYTSPTWVDDTSSSSDDQTFASAWSISGGQGTGTKFAAYVVGKGCTVLDTATGVVTGDWGFTGTLTLPISGGFNIHNQKISHDGKYAIISCTSNGNGCGALQFLWQIGTNSFVAAASIPTSGGHGHAGYSNIVNGVNSPSGQIDIRPLANPAAVTQIFDSFHLPPGIAAPDDFHSGWNNVDLLDTYPFLMAFYQPYTAPNTGIVCGLASVSGSTLTFVSGHLFDTGWTGNIDVEGAVFPIASVASTNSLTVTGSPGTSASTSFCHNPITYAWPEEIVAVSPWTGVAHRFGHCFTTGSDAHIFGAEFCIGSVSQDGQFYAFPSNWLGTLGSNAGSASCTSTTNCRSDVFLMTLK